MKIVKIYELLEPENITLDIEASSKESLVRELVSLLGRSGKVKDEAALIEEAMRRERVGTTGLGDGIAIPHARTDLVKGIAVAFGLSRRGIEFAALDGRPVHVVLFFAIPAEAVREYLMLLAHTARLFKKKDFVEHLMACTSPEQVIATFARYEE